MQSPVGTSVATHEKCALAVLQKRTCNVITPASKVRCRSRQRTSCASSRRAHFRVSAISAPTVDRPVAASGEGSLMANVFY